MFKPWGEMRVSIEGKQRNCIMACASPWNRHPCAVHLLMSWRTVRPFVLSKRSCEETHVHEWNMVLAFVLHRTVRIKEVSLELWGHEGAKPRLVWQANTCDSHTLPQPRVKYHHVFRSLNALSSLSSRTAGVVYSFFCVSFRCVLLLQTP